MMPRRDPVIVCVTPFERADASLLVAACRAGALGVLDLGRDPKAAEAALDAATRLLPSTTLGIRVPEGIIVDPQKLPPAADLVVLSSAEGLSAWRPRRVFVQVCSIAEARLACEAG